jgi:hypothetical protein
VINPLFPIEWLRQKGLLQQQTVEIKVFYLNDESVNDIRQTFDSCFEEIKLVIDRDPVNDSSRYFPDFQLLPILLPGRVVTEPNRVRDPAIRSVVIRNATAFVGRLGKIGPFNETLLTVA